MEKNQKGYLALVIIISLFVGALGGMSGAFFVAPYLETKPWGQQFLKTNINEPPAKNEDEIVTDVVKKTFMSVVSVVAEKAVTADATGPEADNIDPNDIQKETVKEKISGGTGFVIDTNGLILTNKHVVEDRAADYSVVFNDGKSYPAQVPARDAVSDLAVLKIEVTNLPVLPIGDSDKISIGETVIAIGNALSEYNNTVTKGIVSGINRNIVAGGMDSTAHVIEGAIQTDTAINSGNSGGPLINLRGEVIGINTAVNFNGVALGFAIPSNQLKSVVASIKQFGKIVRPWLGVRYLQINEYLAEKENLKYTNGAYITQGEEKDPAIVADSPAAKAGLADKDIIFEVNGVKLDQDHSLVNQIARYKPGDEVTLKIFHQGEEKMIKVVLEERKAEE